MPNSGHRTTPRGTPFEEALAAVKNGADCELEGLTLAVNGCSLAITDVQFDQVWDVMNEVEDDNEQIAADNGW